MDWHLPSTIPFPVGFAWYLRLNLISKWGFRKIYSVIMPSKSLQHFFWSFSQSPSMLGIATVAWRERSKTRQAARGLYCACSINTSCQSALILGVTSTETSRRDGWSYRTPYDENEKKARTTVSYRALLSLSLAKINVQPFFGSNGDDMLIHTRNSHFTLKFSFYRSNLSLRA